MKSYRNEYLVNKIYPQKIYSLKEVKDYLRISYDYDDSLIGTLIEGAVLFAENFTSLSLVEREVTYICDRPDKEFFELKYAPVSYLIKISLGGVELSPENYYLDKTSGALTLSSALRREKLEVIYKGGLAASDVPPYVKRAILTHAAQSYDSSENKEEASCFVKSLYAPYRKLKV